MIPIEENICWRAIPIQYDNYKPQKGDNYNGDVFGALGAFESPHFLWKRFHRNMCKAMVVSKLKNYSLVDHEDDLFVYEFSCHENVSFSIEIISRHQSLILIVSAFEAYLKDCFAEVLKNRAIKEAAPIEIVIRKYNFQNIESINRAFSWLFIRKIEIIGEQIKPALEKRHKIVHESFYDPDFSNQELDYYYIGFLKEAEKLHDFLENNGHYLNIIP